MPLALYPAYKKILIFGEVRRAFEDNHNFISHLKMGILWHDNASFSDLSAIVSDHKLRGGLSSDDLFIDGQRDEGDDPHLFGSPIESFADNAALNDQRRLRNKLLFGHLDNREGLRFLGDQRGKAKEEEAEP
jgi:hypothetical protein